MPKVSVIIPVYNAEAYLDECIQSVLNSTYKNFEIILVDDKSTDSSADIIKNYMKHEPRIKYIYTPVNKGAGACRNIGIKSASGDLISFLDDDDFYMPDFLEIMVKAYKKNLSDIIISFYYDINGHSKTENHLNFSYGFEPDEIISKETIPKYILNVFSYPIWNRLYNKKFLLDNNIFFEEVMCGEDGYFNKISIVKANTITLIPQCLMAHRAGIPSFSTKYNQHNYNVIDRCLKQLNTLKELQVSDEIIQSLINSHLEDAFEHKHFPYMKNKDAFITVYSRIKKYIKLYPKSYIYNPNVWYFMTKLKLLPLNIFWYLDQFNYNKGKLKNNIKKFISNLI